MNHPKARNIPLAIAAAVWLFAGVAGAEPVGFIAVANGQVDVQRYGTNSWEAATLDADVSVGDTIRTGFDSQAKIILVDDTTLSIDEDTEITIQSLHVGAAATRDRSIIRQARGKMRTVVGSAFGGQTRLEVHTPTAVVGVKGTDFTSEKDDEARLTGKDKDKGQWLLCLVDGKIIVRTPGGVATPSKDHCVITYFNGEISDELLNDAEPFAIAFSSAGFAGGDFVAPGTPDVGEGPAGGGGDGYTDGTGTGGGGPGGGGDPGENSGGDELGIGSTTPPIMDEMEMPPADDDEGSVIIIE
jgi:hypothetical protein